MSEQVAAVAYVVRPTGYDEMVHADRDSWCLYVVDGGSEYGWAIRRGGITSPVEYGPNGDVDFAPIPSSRTKKYLKAHRWPLDKALDLARAHVDSIVLNGCTAQEASDSVAARLAATR